MKARPFVWSAVVKREDRQDVTRFDLARAEGTKKGKVAVVRESGIYLVIRKEGMRVVARLCSVFVFDMVV